MYGIACDKEVSLCLVPPFTLWNLLLPTVRDPSLTMTQVCALL